MPVFEVRLNGSNFWLEVDGEPRRMGFYLNQYVREPSAEEAETSAVQLVREDSRMPRVLNDPEDPPMIYAEQIVELDPQTAKLPSQQGFAFYPEETDA